MIAFLGVSGALVAAAVGGYVLHIFLPLSRIKDWAVALLGKIGLKIG